MVDTVSAAECTSQNVSVRIFVAGAQHSGTAMLRPMLNAHPQIAVSFARVGHFSCDLEERAQCDSDLLPIGLLSGITRGDRPCRRARQY